MLHLANDTFNIETFYKQNFLYHVNVSYIILAEHKIEMVCYRYIAQVTKKPFRDTLNSWSLTGQDLKPVGSHHHMRSLQLGVHKNEQF